MNHRLRLAAVIIFCPVLCPIAFLAGAIIGAGLAISEGIAIKLLDAEVSGNPNPAPANTAENATLRTK